MFFIQTATVTALLFFIRTLAVLSLLKTCGLDVDSLWT
jgi:hypothetical protein